jgi:hypothetical protein
MSRSRLAPSLVGVLSILTLACSHPRHVPPPPPASEPDRYCWWTLLRTALPPDTVAKRFEAAYRTLGLQNVSVTHRADTAWAHAGPSLLVDDPTRASFASTAIAVRQGDSTSFRYFVEITSPPSATSDAPDRIEFCGRIAKAARIAWSTPQRRPNSADSLAVFIQRP